MIPTLKTRNKIFIELMAYSYLNANEAKSLGYNVIVNSLTKSVFYQIKGLVAVDKFTSENAASLWYKIKDMKNYGNYIINHYNIYWNKHDCIFLDKFYKLFADTENIYVKSFLASIMIEVMIQQSVFKRFNVNTEGYIQEQEILTKHKFLFIVEDFKNKIRSGHKVNVVCNSLSDFINSLSTAGIVYLDIPSRNVFYDYHPIYDIFENYGNGHFSDKRLHISDEVKKMAEKYPLAGDRFIKFWSRFIPQIFEIDLEYFVIKIKESMDIERSWFIDKLSNYGKVFEINNFLVCELNK